MSDEISQEPEVTRRSFLKTTGAVAAAAGLAITGLAATVRQAEAACGEMPKKWDETYDVIVVGTGFAGLSAAIEARHAGAEVLVIEKMRTHGGNSIINGREMAVAGTKWQKEAGIQDSPELFMKDLLKAGSNLNHPELARTIAEQSGEALDWCQNFVGARFVKLVFHGGHSVKRSVQTDNASGSGLVNPLFAKAKSMGVKFQFTTKMERLITDKEGRVVGLEIKKGYKFPDDRSGKASFVKARKAVVLASGGFSQNVELRQIQDPRIDSRFDSTNHPGATGEATLAACRAGAMDVQMDWIQMGPWTSPDEKGFGHVPQFCERLVGYGPMIDPKTGRRFIQETGNRKVRADAMMALGYPTIIFGDAVNVKRQVLSHTLEKGMANGAIKRFDTIEELAANYGIPLAALKEEIAKWNSYVEKRKDPDFNCKIFPETTPTVVAPFYACRLWPRVHHCMGGLVIDKNAQVKGFNLKPIKGLYAAGEVTGGVHGAVRLGTCAMLDCVVFGRIAGKNAAKEKNWG
ncbi:flavocytochrome c [Trichlorobacter lovleyi]|uniref:flavocytochrome c n=1 Tax=Trichlorobacter lovleyi TaxID=313985 RepID=UPI003D0D32CD